jgi:basic membrane protein A and related proteins
MKSKVFLVVIVLIFLAGLPIFAGGSKETKAESSSSTGQTESSSSSAQEGPFSGWKIASIMPGPINDAGFSASAYNGLLELEEMGAEIAYSDRVEQTDAEAIIGEYAMAGFDIVMASGYEFDDALVSAAEKYPDTKFVQIDGGVENDNNLYSFGYLVGEGGYLLGLIAGSLTEKNVIGLLGGGTDPAMVWEFELAKRGVKEVAPGAEIMEAYVGSWYDPVKAKELAQGQIEAGADILISVCDAGDMGVVEAAQQAYDNGLKSMRVISWGEDKNEIAPELLISGWTTANARLMKEAAEAIIVEEKPAGHYVFGLREGVVGLLPYHGLVPPNVEKLVEEAIEDYLSGDLVLEIRDDI